MKFSLLLYKYLTVLSGISKNIDNISSCVLFTDNVMIVNSSKPKPKAPADIPKIIKNVSFFSVVLLVKPIAYKLLEFLN